jgi:hypothetical protein
MKTLEAFQLGLFAQLVGFRFHGVEVIERIKPAEGNLLAVAKKHVAALNQRNQETIDLVMRLDALLEKNGVASPGRPRTLDEYLTWSAALRERTLAATAGDVQAQTAFNLGHALGAATATASVGSMIEDLRSQAAENAYLRQRATAMHTELASARKQLELLQGSPALPDEARAAAREAAAQLAPPEGDPAAAARALRATVHALTPLRERLLALFKDEPG